MVCTELLEISAEHIVKRIAQPGDDLDALRLAAREYLIREAEKVMA